MHAYKVDVVVVGAGIMGASTAWQLARSGLRVALLEQFELTHARGSSHGSSRIFRLPYVESEYVRLALSALPLWREVERALEKELLWTTGGVDIGPISNLQPLMHALASSDVPYDCLTPEQAGRRFPWFRFPPDWHAVYQRDTGILNADACRQGFTQLARSAGAQVLDGTRVDRLVPGDREMVVETTAGRWSADQVVLASAGWSNPLLQPLGLAVPMKITREHIAYFPYAGENFPLPFICHGRDTSFDFYGLPNWKTQQVKAGKHAIGPEVDPDSEAVIEGERLYDVFDFVRTHLPICNPEPSRGETCLYASTPDDDFVVDRVGRVVLGIGFGGHGFKFGAIIGWMLADIVRGASVPSDSRFAYARFAATRVSRQASSS